MSKEKLYMDYLVEEGYRPSLDEDGDIIFKREGGTYVLYLEEDDPNYFRLVFPGFWEIENEEERTLALQVMAEVNSDRKVVKLYPYHDNTYAAIEMFIDPMENFRNIFERAMRVLVSGISMFRERMRELITDIETKRRHLPN